MYLLRVVIHRRGTKARLCRALHLLSSDNAQEFSGTAGRTRCGKDRLAVALEDSQPAVDVSGMIGARLGGDTKITAEERRAKLGALS